MGNNSDLDLESLDSFDVFNEYDIPLSPHADIDISDMNFSDSNSESKNENNDQGDDQGDQDNPMINPVWTKEYSNFNVPEFTVNTGLVLPHDFPDTSEATPTDYFKLYFNQELMEIMENCMNDYSQWYQTNKRIIDPDYTNRLWYPMSRQEISVYLGILILFGLSPSARTRDYWFSDPFLGNDYVKKIMMEKRFEKMTQYFHCSDRSSEPLRGSPNYDPLFKTRKFITSLSLSYQRFMRLAKFSAVDEAMVNHKSKAFKLKKCLQIRFKGRENLGSLL